MHIRQFPFLTRLTDAAPRFLESWPPEPYVHCADSSWAKALLTFDAVDRLIADYGLSAARVSLIEGGVIAGQGTTPTVSTHLLADGLRDGSTMLLQGLHECWPALGEFCRGLMIELGTPVQANAYLTPPKSQGFGPHWDATAAFLVQTEGAKRWQVHEPESVDPLMPGRPEAVTDLPPFLETELRPGDVLWLPRGWIHHGYTENDWSLHVTVGIRQFTPHALLAYLLRGAAEDAALRASLPPRATPSAAADQLREAAIGWLSRMDDERVAALLRQALGPDLQHPVSAAMKSAVLDSASSAEG